MKKLFLLLLLCLFLIGAVSATSLQYDFQKSVQGWSSSSATQRAVVDYIDDFAMQMYPLPDNYIYPSPEVYFPITYFAWSGKITVTAGSEHQQQVWLLNSANVSIIACDITVVDGDWHRYEFVKNNTYFDYYRDGVYINQFSVGVSVVYRFLYYGHLNTGNYYIWVDDAVINGEAPHILGSIPSDTEDISTNWYLKKSYIDPTNLGLFDSSDTLVYTSAMHSSFGISALVYPKTNWETKTYHVDTGTLVDTTALSGYAGRSTYNTTAMFFSASPQRYGWYRQELIGDGAIYDINYFYYIASGGVIDWNSTSYRAFDPASVSWTLTTLDPGYDYSCKVISLDTGVEFTTWAVTTLSGSHDVDLSSVTTTGPYAVYLIATSSGGIDYVINTDVSTVEVTSRFIGHVYNAETEAVVSGATVGLYQSSAWNNATTGAGGDYTIDGCVPDVSITASVSAVGYTHHDFSFTVYANGEYTLDLYLIPASPAHTGTAINGLVYQSGLHQAVPSAIVTRNVTAGTTVANSSGYYIFNSLSASTLYNLVGSHTDYGNSSNYAVTTGGAGTVTYQGIEIPASYDVVCSAYDYYSHALISDTVTFTFVGTTGTYTGSGLGTAAVTVPYGFYTITAVSANYNVSSTTTAFVYEDRTLSFYMVRSPETPISDAGGVGIQYPPHQVRFVLLDYFGNPITDATVVATTVSTTMGEWGWLGNLFGIDTSVDIQGDTMTGITGSDGSIDFIMMESIKYSLLVTRASDGINHTVALYPHESEIILRIPTVNAHTPAPRSSSIIYNFTATTLSNSSAALDIKYGDTGSGTTSISFFVQNSTGANVTSTDVTSPTQYDWTYTLPYVAGGEYYYGFNASTSKGWVNETRIISFKNNIPLTGIDSTIKTLGSLGFVILVFAGFSKRSISQGMVIGSMFAILFVYVGWLNMIGDFTIPVLFAFLGGLMYMSEHHREVTA